MSSDVLSVSVRKLVEFVMMSGSIDSRFAGSNVMQEGTKTHQRLQASRGENYEKEVHLSLDYAVKSYLLHIEGRCDGIYFEENETIIEEIKTTARELSTLTELDFPTYWAQAKMYAYIYGLQHELDEMTIHMVFARRDSQELRTFIQTYRMEELTVFVEKVTSEYIYFVELLMTNKEKREESIADLSFPYDTYREGQRDLAKAVYKTVQEKKKLFAKASTGIGKTIATIFPSVLSLGKNGGEKILYLTAKTVTRLVAEEAFQLLMAKGLAVIVVTVTAKDKICFQEETRCQKEFCPFADGYYDRLKDGLADILNKEQMMNRAVIERYARKHSLCPFEFSLDIAMFADVVICDYNYFFDPRVRLQRWSDFHKETIVLIDEAHNLVDRSREMFSATLTKSLYLQAIREIKSIDKELYASIKKVNDALLSWKKELLLSNEFVFNGKPISLIEVLVETMADCERWLKINPSGAGVEEVLAVYFEGQSFLKIAKEYNDSYKTIVTIFQSEVIVKLVCMDPSSLLKKLTRKAHATVFFSATLHPLKYFQTILGGEETDYHITIETPFLPEQITVYASKVSTKYKDREASIAPIVKGIKENFHTRKGNFLLFFPSYEYLTQVYDTYKEYAEKDNIGTIVQQPIMTEEEREEFLLSFVSQTEKTLIGFAVLGGIFAEGIDLKGDRLTGVGIIGVGLPKLTLERNVMKKYFQEEKGQNGFDFAYLYPGMNKVQQAGGRLIRSEQDKGFLILFDERYFSDKYKNLLPPEWRNFKVL